MLFALPASAATLLRDADIEHSLGELARPILQAAGLNPQRVRVLVVDDGSLNAFIIDAATIYIHSGLIQRVETPEQLQAVIAHEAAHIANGHIARRMGNMQSARTVAGLGIALAVIAAAAGGGDAAGGIAAGTSSSALRVFLKHTRAEESSADQSAARYMRSAGVDPRGLVDLHKMFRGQEVLSEQRQDPYMRSHPFSRDRMRAAEAYVAASGGPIATPASSAYWFARAKGKLTAFARSPKWTMGRAKSDPYADIRLMREAVAHHRRSDLKSALRAIDGAIAQRPRDGYYHDLKGQILLESRQWNAALAAYKQAAALAPNEPLIQAGLGRTLLAAGQPKSALTALERARERDFRDGRVLRDMANAYAQTGQMGMAAVVTAERYALQGRLDDAGIHAKRGMDLLARGTVGWRRAQDVFIAAERNAKRRK
jgi:predicted Zn-dependent protease